jgi:hypothetical protein
MDMKVTVTVDSNLRIRDLFEPPIRMELPEGEETLKDLLSRLSSRCRHLKFLEGGEMGDDLHHVYVNGQSHFRLPEGLNRRLSDGDTVRVEAYMDPLAGG